MVHAPGTFVQSCKLLQWRIHGLPENKKTITDLSTTLIKKI